MTRVRTITGLALLVALSPFLGLPYSWLMWLLPILGLLIVFIALSSRRSAARHEEPPVA